MSKNKFFLILLFFNFNKTKFGYYNTKPNDEELIISDENNPKKQNSIIIITLISIGFLIVIIGILYSLGVFNRKTSQYKGFQRNLKAKYPINPAEVDNLLKTIQKENTQQKKTKEEQRIQAEAEQRIEQERIKQARLRQEKEQQERIEQKKKK